MVRYSPEKFWILLENQKFHGKSSMKQALNVMYDLYDIDKKDVDL